ncbi:MAG: hypothetical protein ACRC9E_09135 [Plesiomonas shigelloides]
MKKATPRKTYNITADRQIRLERMAIDISSKTGKTVKWTDIMVHLIDNYAKDAAEDIKAAKKE